MQSFSIGVLKERGRSVMKVNYWKYVVAALLLDIFIMGSGGSASSYKSTFDEIRNPGIGDSQFPDIFSGESLAFLALFSGIFITAAIIGILIGIFLFGPLEVGLRRVFVMGQREPANLNEIGVGFKINYWNVVKIMFFRDLYLFLWSLLFVIPGIIKWYEYRMIPYLLAENPNMSMEEAFGRSKDMTYGDKWNIFVLDLSFIGWILLAAFTANIVRIFYVGPYIYATNAELYSALKYKTGYQPAPECLNYGKPNYGAYYGNSYQGGYGNQNGYGNQAGYGDRNTWNQNNANPYGSQTGYGNQNTWNQNNANPYGSQTGYGYGQAAQNGPEENTAESPEQPAGGTETSSTETPTDAARPYDDSQNR